MKLSREEKKLQVEQLLDEVIERYEPYYEAAERLCEEISPAAYVLGSKKEIVLHGVVELGELLGCCITFKPDGFGICTMACIEYKGFLFVQNVF